MPAMGRPRGGARKDWVPADPSALFEGSLAELRGLFSRARGSPATRASRRLWLGQLRACGAAPASGADGVFVAHTLIVLVSRMVSNAVRGRRGGVSGGFAGWVAEADGSFLGRLEGVVGGHDWAGRRGDVLRALYGSLVEGRHRRASGEHYTPDWLAEMVCLEAIEEGFISEQAAAFGGGGGGGAVRCVLDPACGSGTFLYSAARRILESDALARSPVGDGQRALFASSMVCGVDAHPVAVEMARANMARALPGAPDPGAGVIRGDSLLASPRGAGAPRAGAAAALLGGRRVGRIVSNPPWVTLQEIQDVARKAEVRRLAGEEGLWVGGEVAPRFDIAGLFVTKCVSTYLDGGMSAWVLPQGAAVSGKNWEGFRAAMDGKILEFWDMKRLPFAWTPACVAITGRGSGKITRTYVKKSRVAISDGDRWESVKPKIKKTRRSQFTKKQSSWFDKSGRLPVKHGASLQPAPLVRIERITKVSEGEVSFETYASHKSPWSRLGSLRGTVPPDYVKDTIISTFVYPFVAKCNKTVIPVRDGRWADGREKNAYWRGACALYEKHRGLGKSNPETLESCMDHNAKLTKQLQNPKRHRVVYNAVGDILYAARLEPGVIGGVGVCVVSAGSEEEAQFLVGILNAPCLLGAYLSTRRSDRNFHLHFWSVIPIPRYNKLDRDHEKLVRCVQRAELAASKVGLGSSPIKNKNLIREAVAGTLADIDEVVSRMLPGHAGRPDSI